MRNIFFVLVLMTISQFTYAQVNTSSDKIVEEVEKLNKESEYAFFNYDEISNVLNYQISFPDAESFKTLTHFKSVESIFKDAYNKLESSGELEKILSIGINDFVLVLKNEKDGSIFDTKLMNLSNI